jgi:hypothetical protein
MDRAGGFLCVFGAGFALAVTFVCALYAAIANSQDEPPGVFLLAGLVCFLITCAFVGVGIAL